MRSLVLLTFCVYEALAQKPCVPKTFSGLEPRIVCVCNATYCDEFPPIGSLEQLEAAVYTSSISGKRFQKVNARFQTISASGLLDTTVKINLDSNTPFQNIIGFGGAFTDSAGVNLNRLSPLARDNLLRAYFGDEGIGYTLGRVIIASADFSTHVYSYDDITCDDLALVFTPNYFNGSLVNCTLELLEELITNGTINDFNLVLFNLTIEDFTLKIPHIKAAQQLLGDQQLKLFATPFSAPAWMKLTGFMEGGGPLKGDVTGPYYQTWAKYFLRFFEEYAKQEVNFWGLTLQNEPIISLNLVWWQGTGFTAEMQRDFLKLWLGPALKNSSITNNLKVMIMDDQRTFLPAFPNTVLADPDAAQYVDGIGVHWYFDSFTPADLTLDATHDAHPDKFILGTEASQGYLPGEAIGLGGPSLGNWQKGADYANDIIQDLQSWVSGWTEWNLCLDEQGGPTWVGTNIHGLDPVIVVNNTIDEFYKEPMYYVLGHFSKFIRPDSTRIQMSFDCLLSSISLNGVAFITPSNQTVVVIHNTNKLVSYQVSIRSQNPNLVEKELKLTIDPQSIHTIVWNN